VALCLCGKKEPCVLCGENPKGGAILYLTKVQKEIFDYIENFIRTRGYAPSMEEIARHFRYTSLATVHKHLTHLQQKKLIRRKKNSSRSIELVPVDSDQQGWEVPLLGFVAAGRPIEAIQMNEVISVPPDMVARRGKTYVLQVRGDSMIDEQIRDGDYVIVEDRQTAENGEVVIALIDKEETTLKKFYREKNGSIRLQPANRTMKALSIPSERVRIQGIVIGILRKY
jgi:repressor LexA